MFYYLLYPISRHIFGFNVFRYISFRAAGAAVTALLISFLLGPYLIRKLKKKQIGEEIRSDGPASHLSKQGTPTFGGILILASTVIPLVLWCRLDNIYVQLILVATIWAAAIGFLDDYNKVIKK